MDRAHGTTAGSQLWKMNVIAASTSDEGSFPIQSGQKTFSGSASNHSMKLVPTLGMSAGQEDESACGSQIGHHGE